MYKAKNNGTLEFKILFLVAIFISLILIYEIKPLYFSIKDLLQFLDIVYEVFEKLMLIMFIVYPLTSYKKLKKKRIKVKI